jgi:hypothetical protein
LEHEVPQLIPDGLLVTVPLPYLTTLRVAVSSLKFAVQDLLPPMVTTPSRQSESPLHPVKIEPGDGTELRETTVPDEYACEQSLPQLIPAGLLVMLPLPVPSALAADAMLTVKI